MKNVNNNSNFHKQTMYPFHRHICLNVHEILNFNALVLMRHKHQILYVFIYCCFPLFLNIYRKMSWNMQSWLHLHPAVPCTFFSTTQQHQHQHQQLWWWRYVVYCNNSSSMIYEWNFSFLPMLCAFFFLFILFHKQVWIIYMNLLQNLNWIDDF